ncbi:hypothetical protein [Chryseobacterium indoltheticum]|nr:hypothetical protein [Chryseobacterium indoltheticum]
MENTIHQIDEDFKSEALKIVYDEFLTFKTLIDARISVKQIKEVISLNESKLPAIIAEKYINLSREWRKSEHIDEFLKNDNNNKTHFSNYIEYFEATCAGYLQKKGIVVD